MPIDRELARHCLHPQMLGKASQFCPVVKEMNMARTPHPACEGRAPVEMFRDWLDQTIEEMNNTSPTKTEISQAELQGQATALVNTIAVLEDPYNPEPERVKLEAMARVVRR